jgi:hypothetical protein
MTIYHNHTHRPTPEGEEYACITCSEVSRYGLQADPDVIEQELRAHTWSPRRDWSEWAKGQLRLYKAKRAKAEFRGLRQADIDRKPDDWMWKSDSINARLKRLGVGD